MSYLWVASASPRIIAVQVVTGVRSNWNSVLTCAWRDIGALLLSSFMTEVFPTVFRFCQSPGSNFTSSTNLAVAIVYSRYNVTNYSFWFICGKWISTINTFFSNCTVIRSNILVSAPVTKASTTTITTVPSELMNLCLSKICCCTHKTVF